jgi:myo-inositol-1(or 4)-monophosphatase
MNKKYQSVFDLVEKAGDRLLPSFGNIETLKHKDAGSDASALTQLDLDTEKFLTEGLSKLFPEIGFHGEEYGIQGDKKYFWTLDPIDGTSHFVRGLPFCTVMVGLIKDGEVIFGLIYDFVKKDFYWAEKGKGAYKNRQLLHVSDRPMNRAYISFETNFGISGALELYKKVSLASTDFRSVNAGWEFAQIASGKLDGRILLHPYCSLWDVAPGSLLVAEAGGKVANIGSQTYDVFNRDFMTVNPKVYEFLTQGNDAIFPITK